MKQNEIRKIQRTRQTIIYLFIYLRIIHHQENQKKNNSNKTDANQSFL